MIACWINTLLLKSRYHAALDSDLSDLTFTVPKLKIRRKGKDWTVSSDVSVSHASQPSDTMVSEATMPPVTTTQTVDITPPPPVSPATPIPRRITRASKKTLPFKFYLVYFIIDN